VVPEKGLRLNEYDFRNARAADGVRAQLGLLLNRLRQACGFEAVFIARIAGTERRIEALAAAPGQGADLAVGHVCALRDCPVVAAAVARQPAPLRQVIPAPFRPGRAPDGAAGVAVLLSDGAVFGVLGGIASDVGADVDARLRETATHLAVALDLLQEDAAVAQRQRGLLRALIREERFRPVFQPVCDLVTGDVIYREGLTRLDESAGTSVPEVIAAAHAVGLGPEVELGFARAILAADRDWPDAAGLAINLSESTLHAPDFEAFLAQEAEPGLTVELTEHEPVRDYPALVERVAMMRAAGLSLAIDDAGAGYTSLRHILDLKPDVLKMDAGLSARVDTDPEALALFRALQGYCDETGTILVIEGIERAEQLAALRAVGVRYVQGFHVGAPEERAQSSG
jgi:EAL domain-containing protein (putative c-di-GMP-specific phosphodiesterase class I)